MKIASIILAFVFSFIFPGITLYAQTEQVSEVAEEYTLLLASGARVRLSGIDIPRELPRKDVLHSFAKLSKGFTQELLKGKTVTLEFDDYEQGAEGLKYAYVYLENGILVNEKIVQEGFAEALDNLLNKKYLVRFQTAENEARVNNKGLWQLLTYLTDKTDFSSKIHFSQIPDGTYTGSDSTILGRAAVSIQIKSGRIEKFDILENTYAHAPGIAKAFVILPPQIMKEQSLGVDAVTGATVSSQSIKYAVIDALSKVK